MASRKTIIGLTILFGILGVGLVYSDFFVLHRALHFRHDGFWSLGVCLALIWGLIESRRQDGGRKVTPDPQSKLKLTT